MKKQEYTVIEYAKLKGVGRSAIYKQIRLGKIPPNRIKYEVRRIIKILV